MIDKEIVEFLTRKRDEAALAVQRAQEELARREAALKQYQSGEVTVSIPGEDEGPDPIEVWEPILSTGAGFTREEMLQALKSAGWSRDYETRAFNMAINTNMAAGNIILREDGRYYKTTPVEKSNAMAIFRANRKKSQ